MQKKKKCIQCGGLLPHSTQLHKRKYCSTTCRNKFKLREKKPDVKAKLWQHDSGVFTSAMEMYWRGHGGASIAQHFGIPSGTVYSWIHDFGARQTRTKQEITPQIIRPKVKTFKEQFKEAKNADEWLGTLRESAAISGKGLRDLPIRLVCGALHGASAGKLATVISESLHENPMSGISYAFCNKGCNIITVITWISPIFELSKYVKVSGTFTWPNEKLGKTIEITRAEFDGLLLVKKQRKTSKS